MTRKWMGRIAENQHPGAEKRHSLYCEFTESFEANSLAAAEDD
jgi:hypothetical protein